jgi:hypothetical protein
MMTEEEVVRYLFSPEPQYPYLQPTKGNEKYILFCQKLCGSTFQNVNRDGFLWIALWVEDYCLWDVSPFGLTEAYRQFEDMCCLRIHGRRILTVKMVATLSLETPVNI